MNMQVSVSDLSCNPILLAVFVSFCQVTLMFPQGHFQVLWNSDGVMSCVRHSLVTVTQCLMLVDAIPARLFRRL